MNEFDRAGRMVVERSPAPSSLESIEIRATRLVGRRRRLQGLAAVAALIVMLLGATALLDQPESAQPVQTAGDPTTTAPPVRHSSYEVVFPERSGDPTVPPAPSDSEVIAARFAALGVEASVSGEWPVHQVDLAGEYTDDEAEFLLSNVGSVLVSEPGSDLSVCLSSAFTTELTSDGQLLPGCGAAGPYFSGEADVSPQFLYEGVGRFLDGTRVDADDGGWIVTLEVSDAWSGAEQVLESVDPAVLILDNGYRLNLVAAPPGEVRFVLPDQRSAQLLAALFGGGALSWYPEVTRIGTSGADGSTITSSSIGDLPSTTVAPSTSTGSTPTSTSTTMTVPDTAGPAESTTTTISEEMTPSVLPPDVIPQPADSWGVQFMVDQRPDPGATELVAFVAYRECSGGKSPVGRMHDPIVLETDGSIAVALFADPLPGDMFTCPLVWDREHPLTISLLSPVAGRAIYDVGGRVMLVSAAG